MRPKSNSPSTPGSRAVKDIRLSGVRSYETDCGYNLEEDFGLIAVTKERR